MNKKYTDLFKEIARATAVAAEEVMDYDETKKDEQGFKAAEAMRKDFLDLYEYIGKEDFDGTFSSAQYSHLLAGSYIVMNNIQDRINMLKKALAGYQKEMIPKLEKIVAAKSDEERQKIADEEFSD